MLIMENAALLKWRLWTLKYFDNIFYKVVTMQRIKLGLMWQKEQQKATRQVDQFPTNGTDSTCYTFGSDVTVAPCTLGRLYSTGGTCYPENFPWQQNKKKNTSDN